MNKGIWQGYTKGCIRDAITKASSISRYQLTDSDISSCGKGQKFVPMPMRVDLIKKHEDFIKFSRKLRFQVYFDNRTDKDS